MKIDPIQNYDKFLYYVSSSISSDEDFFSCKVVFISVSQFSIVMLTSCGIPKR